MKNFNNFHEFCQFYNGIDFYNMYGGLVYKFQVYWSGLNHIEIEKKYTLKQRPPIRINY